MANFAFLARLIDYELNACIRGATVPNPERQSRVECEGRCASETERDGQSIG